MNSHRLPVDYGDQLHFEPAYALRFAFAGAVALFWIGLLVIANLRPDMLAIRNLDPAVASMVVDLAAPFVLGGTGLYLRGKYLCLDRHKGQILQANGFMGQLLGWTPVGVFDPTGTIRFQFCKAELQSLCVMSYQAPGETNWLVLHIYTDPELAREAARELRSWEKRLSVTEMQDQGALPTVRGEKPLVD